MGRRSFLSGCENSVATATAKDALDGYTSDELIPFSDQKSCVKKYMLELWQSEWPSQQAA